MKEKIIIIKPNIIKKGEDIINKAKIAIEENIGKISGEYIKLLTQDNVNYLYKHLENRDDVSPEKLISIKEFMFNTPVHFLVIDTNKSYEEIRNIIGSRHLEEGSLRKIFHEDSDESYENSFHFPDSDEQMLKELDNFGLLNIIKVNNKLNSNKKIGKIL